MRGALLLAFLLGGCATTLQPPYATVDVREVEDAQALHTDAATCERYARAHRTPLSLATIVSKSAQGGLSTLGYAPIAILAPVAGAGGAGGAEILRESGITTDAQWASFVKCLTLKGERSRLYLVVEP